MLDRFVETRTSQHGAHSILDVGCGNGRFAALARARLGDGIEYVGLDASPLLTSRAREKGPSSGGVFIADFVTRPVPIRRDSGRFDLVVAFAVLHHVPSWERRRSLMVELAGLLRKDGMLAVSFWQFAREDRFSKRFVDWEEGAPEIVVADLEEGDHLIRWGDGEALRYCHYAGPAEAAELTFASGLRRVETFRGDGCSGSSNLYHMLCHAAVTAS